MLMLAKQSVMVGQETNQEQQPSRNKGQWMEKGEPGRRAIATTTIITITNNITNDTTIIISISGWRKGDSEEPLDQVGPTLCGLFDAISYLARPSSDSARPDPRRHCQVSR